MRDLEQTVGQALGTLCADIKGPVCVAVSGGGDSLGLLYLCADWARQIGREIYALTVDHGLRPEAADEAAGVAAHCAALGITHQTLKWHPPAGPVGQARSRRARHLLLASAARALGSHLLLMGHTCEDQAETIAMRASRAETGEGMAGMRAMAVSPVWPEGRDIFIGRPCLDIQRGTLRDYLRQIGVNWVDDPSNLDTTYERVRVRQALAQAEPGDDKASFDAIKRRARQGRVLSAWLKDGVSTRSDGVIRFDAGALAGWNVDKPALIAGLAWILMAAAGSDKRSARAARTALAGDILANPHKFRARTLGGAWIAPRQGFITFARDPGHVEKMPYTPQPGQIWDGRFQFMDRATLASAMKTACNQLISSDLENIAPMARATVPRLEGTGLQAFCLIPARLKQVAFMLDYDNLICKTTKNGGNTSLQAV